MSMPTQPSPTKSRRTIIIAALIFLVVWGAIAATARGPGLSWDESIYYGFAFNYFHAIQNPPPQPFSQNAITEIWWNGQVHPPLGKVWIASSFLLFGGLFDVISAARIGAGIIFALCAVVLFLWTSKRRGDVAGIIATAAFVLMPRVFAHGHFANLEMLMVLLWLATTVAFERGIHDKRWSVICGVLFGLALLTKINAVFLPIVLGAWGGVFHGRKVFRNLFWMAGLGGIIFFTGWPALWHHPIQRISAYLADKAKRGTIPTYYFGKIYSDPHAPFHYPFAMLLATTPLIVLAPAIYAIRKIIKKLRASWRDEAGNALMLWSFAFPVLLLAMPGVPKYDGIRLMLCAYPFLAALTAEGICAAWPTIQKKFTNPKRAAIRIAVLGLFWLLIPVILFSPFQLSYYGELAGGPWGAKKLGFETTYWNETLNSSALTWLDKNVPPNGSVALLNVGSMVWQFYPAMGEVRKDITPGSFEDKNWDYLVIIPRQGMLDANIQKFMAQNKPVWTNSLRPFDSPPVCLIYAKPKR